MEIHKIELINTGLDHFLALHDKKINNSFHSSFWACHLNLATANAAGATHHEKKSSGISSAGHMHFQTPLGGRVCDYKYQSFLSLSRAQTQRNMSRHKIHHLAHVHRLGSRNFPSTSHADVLLYSTIYIPEAIGPGASSDPLCPPIPRSSS